VIKTKSNKLQIKTKVIITFVLLFICGYNHAQTICRDTSCAEFVNALEENDSIPKNFTGYIRYRHQVQKMRTIKASFGGSNFNSKGEFIYNDVRDIIKPSPLEFERDSFKIGQTYKFEYITNGSRYLSYTFHDNGKIASLRYNYGKASRKWIVINKYATDPLITYYKNGNISRMTYIDQKQGKLMNMSYYPNQSIRYKSTYSKGEYNGVVSSYYQNGKVEKIGTAKENLINGYVLSYSETGELLSANFYEKNIEITNIDTSKYKSQLFMLKLLADEENNNIERKNNLSASIENLKKTEEEKLKKEEELKIQEAEIKRKQLELELLAKDKAVSDLTIKAKEAELLRNMLQANEKKKEIEQLNQQKIIDELNIKNKESEIAKNNIEAKNKQKQIQGLENEKKLNDENLKQEKFIKKLMIAGSGLLAVFLVFVFFSLAKSRKANKLIAAQKAEVEKQKEISDSQKHLIEEKQTEIIESITYAKRLQEAILPPQAFINSFIPSNFLLYKPKDIVAGDFYWAENIGDLFFIAAADSTGHGVPGAMVSVVCSNALNRSVKEFNLTETGKILDKTKELVVETFEKSTSEVKDGMDISLLCIDTKNKKVFWSGANNPLWYASSLPSRQTGASASQFSKKIIGKEEMLAEALEVSMFEIKADKQPIGKTDKVNPFTTHEIEYKENTTFYLFTDGFADQFGGPNGKKFKYKPFAEILVQNVNKNPSEQSAILAEKFEAWKGELEQVDDVCIIGVKI